MIAAAKGRRSLIAIGAAALLLGVGVGVVGTSLVVGTSPEPARPQGVRLAGWSEAASVAGVPLRTPPNREQPEQILAWGVVGDPNRPIEARWSDGLRVLQTRADLLPPNEGIGELVRIDRADDAWWHEELDNRYLVVLHGDTISLLSGIDDADLREMAAALEPIQP